VAIGLESGFSSSASFRSVFKEITGMSPREYQRSLEQKVG
jgi:AraC-like DNA-binding protein